MALVEPTRAGPPARPAPASPSAIAHLHILTLRLAREFLAQRRSEVTIDTQIGELATARTFASWCVDQGWLTSDPFDELAVTGARAARPSSD